jgi:lipopolysaccharide/colanic/teichoic acid biosynthesis glycosyltransferase
MKRVFDIGMAFIFLVVLCPLLTVISVLIITSSPGPVFYRGERVGRRGRIFRIFKFRTMVVNAERIGGPSTADDDPRITSVGRRLRKFKLDELPQSINVLRGEMSFVGPRPEVRHYVDMYTEKEKALLSLKPGITDWASLWNNDEGALLAAGSDPEKTYLETIRPEKIRLQLKYLEDHSFLTDLRIIALTIRALFARSGSDLAVTARPLGKPA